MQNTYLICACVASMGSFLPDSVVVVVIFVAVGVCVSNARKCVHTYMIKSGGFSVVAILFAEKLITLENKSCSFDKRPTALIILTSSHAHSFAAAQPV